MAGLYREFSHPGQVEEAYASCIESLTAVQTAEYGLSTETKWHEVLGFDVEGEGFVRHLAFTCAFDEVQATPDGRSNEVLGELVIRYGFDLLGNDAGEALDKRARLRLAYLPGMDLARRLPKLLLPSTYFRGIQNVGIAAGNEITLVELRLGVSFYLEV